jgi:hypothetical protein
MNPQLPFQWDSTFEAKPRHAEIKICLDDMSVKLPEAAR